MKYKKLSAKLISCLLVIVVLSTMFSTVTVHASEPAVPNMSIAGTKITEANKNDILGNGTCSLSYNQNTSRWVLTLNNANIDTTSTAIDVTTSKIDLEINLVGKNNLISRTFYDTIFLSKSNLIITGTGTLDISNTGGRVIGINAGIVDGVNYGNISIINVSDLKISTSSNTAKAIGCAGDLFIEKSNVTASNNSDGNSTISVLGDCLFSDSIVNVLTEGTDAMGVFSDKSLKFTNSTVNVQSKDRSIHAYENISILNSNVKAISSEENAIFAKGSISITGGSNLTAIGFFCGLQAKGPR